MGNYLNSQTIKYKWKGRLREILSIIKSLKPKEQALESE
jgi:hypothetical protein